MSAFIRSVLAALLVLGLFCAAILAADAAVGAWR